MLIRADLFLIDSFGGFLSEIKGGCWGAFGGDGIYAMAWWGCGFVATWLVMVWGGPELDDCGPMEIWLVRVLVVWWWLRCWFGVAWSCWTWWVLVLGHSADLVVSVVTWDWFVWWLSDGSCGLWGWIGCLLGCCFGSLDMVLVGGSVNDFELSWCCNKLLLSPATDYLINLEIESLLHVLL